MSEKQVFSQNGTGKKNKIICFTVIRVKQHVADSLMGLNVTVSYREETKQNKTGLQIPSLISAVMYCSFLKYEANYVSSLAVLNYLK